MTLYDIIIYQISIGLYSSESDNFSPISVKVFGKLLSYSNRPSTDCFLGGIKLSPSMPEKGNLLTKRNRLFFSFRRWPAIWQNHFAVWCLGTTHTSLDVASVSPFHPVAVLSRSALCWNIKDPQMNYKLTLTGLWQTFKRKLTLMEARNTKWGQIHAWND